MKNRSWVLTLGIAAVVAAGCGTPTVHVVHVLPAAVPVGQYRAARLGTFTVKAPTESESRDTKLQGIAQEQFIAAQPASTTVPVGAADLMVDIDVTVTVQDVTGRRAVQGAKRATVASLVRTIDLTAVFRAVGDQPGQRAARVELRRTWTSTADPRVRGDQGLLRPDAPARMPDKDTVVAELFADCVQRFTTMILPPTLTAETPLRGVMSAFPGKQKAAVAAAKAGDYARAADEFGTLAVDEPNNRNLQFNLAVTSEAAGDLQTARKIYSQTFSASGKTGRTADPRAEAMRERIELVLRHRQAAKK